MGAPLTDLQPVLASNPEIGEEATDTSGRMAIMRLNHLHPPFNNPKVRQAVRMAVNQEDYMQATQGDDTTLWQTCRSLWPRGTPYYTGEQEDLMPQNLDKAKAALAASGYAGEKVVIISPTDFPDIGPLGQVTGELLQRLGMNVQMADSDWGTVVQRRGNRESVEKGGWSIFHTTGPAVGWSNPALSLLVRGQGARAGSAGGRTRPPRNWPRSGSTLPMRLARRRRPLPWRGWRWKRSRPSRSASSSFARPIARA